MFRLIRSKWYNSCADLPLFNFIKILVTHDLTYLVIEGKPKNLPEVWEKIFEEYTELTKSEKQTHILNLSKEVRYLSNKVFLVQALVYSLKIQHSEDLVSQLRSQGFIVQLDPKKPDKYYKNLDIVLTQLKTTSTLLAKKSAELEEYNKGGDDKANLESNYSQWLVTLSKFQGYRLDPKEITVTEFINIQKMYMDFLAKNTKKNGK